MSERSNTPKWQRVVIWIIAIAMTVGTLAGFVFMIWATQDKSIDPNQIAQNKANEEYQKELEEQAKQQAEAVEKFRAIDGYSDRVTKFNKDDIKELKVDTLKEGNGATISDSSTISVNYTGWTPDGVIFDSTKSDGADSNPTPLKLTQVITGWKEGLSGKRAGGVYELSIPSSKAYGEQGSGTIAANTPLKFIVQVVSVN